MSYACHTFAAATASHTLALTPTLARTHGWQDAHEHVGVSVTATALVNVSVTPATCTAISKSAYPNSSYVRLNHCGPYMA